MKHIHTSCFEENIFQFIELQQEINQLQQKYLIRLQLTNVSRQHYQIDNFQDFYINQILNQQSNCRIPSNYNGEYNCFQLYNSQFKRIYWKLCYETSLFQVGNKYCLTGWVKYSTKNIYFIKLLFNQINIKIKESTLPKQGDNLFTVDVNIYKNYPQFSKINYRIDAQSKRCTQKCQMRSYSRIRY